MLCFLGPFKHILIISISTKCPITNCKGWLDIWDVRNARNDKYSEVEKDTLWCSLWEPSLMFDDASLSWKFDHKHKHLIVLLETHDNENQIESISWKISASSMGFASSLWLHLFCFAMCANIAAPHQCTKRRSVSALLTCKECWEVRSIVLRPVFCKGCIATNTHLYLFFAHQHFPGFVFRWFVIFTVYVDCWFPFIRTSVLFCVICVIK